MCISTSETVPAAAPGRERLPGRVPGATEVPDGSTAVLPAAEHLEVFLAAIRLWERDPGGRRG